MARKKIKGEEMSTNRYFQLIERIFDKYYTEGSSEVPFERNDLVRTAAELDINLPTNLRTTVKEMGQVETDELYVGIDQRGVQYVFPVQAKGRTDQLGVVQIEQFCYVCRKVS